MANKLVHDAERKAFEMAYDAGLKKITASSSEGYVEIVNAMQKVMGDTWKPEAYDRLRTALGKDGKWTNFFRNLQKTVDPAYVKGLIMSLGFEGGFFGYREAKKNGKKLGIKLPWLILFDPTSACNLHCTGCWAAEYGNRLNLSYEDMDSIVTQAKQLGIHAFAMTGGEPMVRKNDILKLAQKHTDCGFLIFTNGTLVDQAFCDGMKVSNNILLAMSIEGFESATDMRRGSGVFQKVMKTMDLLKANGLVYGTSICYTSKNYLDVTSDEFLDFLISKGVAFSWYFHYMPVGNDASVDLLPTSEQREYMYHRIRSVRGYEGGKPIFLIDFQNDGEFVHGCIAGGRAYCHINAAGDMEPCVFIHYSGANIHDKSLKECLTQPLFRAYQAAQPFNENLLQPCPMLENPKVLREVVRQSGAKSTDLMSPESVDHLCGKCDEYSEVWEPVADELWSSNHPDYQKKA